MKNNWLVVGIHEIVPITNFWLLHNVDNLFKWDIFFEDTGYFKYVSIILISYFKRTFLIMHVTYIWYFLIMHVTYIYFFNGTIKSLYVFENVPNIFRYILENDNLLHSIFFSHKKSDKSS